MVSPGSMEHSLQTEQRAGSLQAPAGTGRLFNAGKMQIQTASLSLSSFRRGRRIGKTYFS